VDRRFYLVNEVWCEGLSGSHKEEENDAFILVGGAALANTERIGDLGGEGGFEDVVDFGLDSRGRVS
jgi:hypothetical protein